MEFTRNIIETAYCTQLIIIIQKQNNYKLKFIAILIHQVLLFIYYSISIQYIMHIIINIHVSEITKDRDIIPSGVGKIHILFHFKATNIFAPPDKIVHLDEIFSFSPGYYC